MDEYLGRVANGQRAYGGMAAGLVRRPKPEKNFGPVPEMWEVELGDGEVRNRVIRDNGKRAGSTSEWAAMEVSLLSTSG